MSTTGDQIHVLHVDDDPSLSDMVATFLEREDERLAVRTATDTEEGQAVLAEDEVECIVSDYDMPGRNGIEFLEAVREEYPDLPFILYTGKGSEEVASEAISAGVTDYLQKESGADHYTVLANRIRNAVERRRAERERKRQLQAIEAAQEGISILDEDGHYIYVNQAFADMHGYDPEEMVGEHWELAYRDEDVPEVREEILPEVEQTGYWHGETTSLRADGSTVDVDHTLSITDRDELICTVRDVTERKERRRQLETLISNLPGVVYRCRNEPEWPMVIIRGECEELTGYSAGEIERGDVVWGEDILHPADQDRMWAAVQEALDNDRPFEVTYRIQTADGATRWMWERGRVVNSGRDGETLLEGFITDITERKRREQELEETNALLATLIESLPAGVLAEDASRSVLTVNERMLQLFGLSGSPAEITGADCEQMAEDVSDMFVDSERFVERINERIAERKPTTDEELVLADGRTFERDYRPIDLPDGAGHLWLYRDVTERVEQERQQETTIEFLQSLYEVATDRALDIDEKITRLLELGPEELDLPPGYLTQIEVSDETPGTGTRRVIEASGDHELLQPGDSCPLSDSYCRKTIATDGVVAIQDALAAGWEEDPAYKLFNLGCYIGTTVTVDDDLYGTVFFASKTPCEDPFTDTERTFVRLMSRLVSYELERDRVTSELEAQRDRLEEQYRTLFGEAPVMAVVTRAEDGRPIIEDCNGRFLDTLGYERDAVVGTDLATYYTSASRERLLDEGGYDRSLEGEFTRERRELLTADGEVVEALLRAVPRRNASGEVVGTMAMYIDITEREAVKRANERLEEFTRIVSHDLRNPLNVAEGQLELARGECESEHLDSVGDALARSQALIDDLLALARDGGEKRDMEPVDLGALAEKCWHNVATAEASIVRDTERVLEADRSRLQQLFENLYRNAIEHGGDDVTVTVGDLADGFYLEDDGRGIPEGERDDVFEAGYSTSEQGTGFGLSIAKQVVAVHGWEINVTEGAEGGARFEITGVEFVDG